MRLLVCTQAVDTRDPALGFFNGWLAEFSKHFDAIEVICLKEGAHQLPSHVRVHSLGKESGASRFSYIVRFYRSILSLRRDYDAVFVHMNEEYMLLGGVLWQLLGRRSVLWRNHKKGSLLTRIACAFASRVCFTSPDSYVAHLSNAVRMPIGIDTEAFSLPTTPAPQRSVLFFGRLDAVKNAHLFLDVLDRLDAQGARFSAILCGSPTYANDAYAASVLARAEHLVEKKVLTLLPAITNEAAPQLYRSHMVYVNLTPSGSFDKTIGEAMASGCIVLAANSAVKDVLESRFLPVLTPEVIAASLMQTLDMPEDERNKVIARQRAYVMAEHSLSLLARRLFGILSA